MMVKADKHQVIRIHPKGENQLQSLDNNWDEPSHI